MLGVRQATSIHRALTVTSALVASLGAHAASTGQLQSLTVAPLIWGSIVAASALVWPARRWQRRGLARSSLVLMAGQAMVHVTMTKLPRANADPHVEPRRQHP